MSIKMLFDKVSTLEYKLQKRTLIKKVEDWGLSKMIDEGEAEKPCN